MAEDFYNPYQFIPATGQVDRKPTPTVAFEEIKNGETQIRHDLWLGNRKSGRIVCSLTLKTPTVVGNEHKPLDTGETRVHPYRIGLDGKEGVPEHLRKGELALPANSLRGMVASVAETLSQSALRVLEKEVYSVRKERSKGLSAIGLLRPLPNPAEDEAVLGIVPLILPTLNLNESHWKIPDEWIALFPGRSLSSCLGAYVDGYYEKGNRILYRLQSFLGTRHPDCFHERRPVFYRARIVSTLSRPKSISGNLANLDGLYKAGGFLLGQRIAGLITEEEFQRDYPNPDDPERLNFQRGVMYVLGIDGRQDQIPATEKKHERFIPVPDDLETLRPIPITKSAWDNFMSIAAHRADASKKEKLTAKRLPFLPRFYMENKDIKQYWVPEAGELMYFKLEGGRATEISYSSIWRLAKAHTIHEAFGTIQKNLLPWKFGGRSHLTPAEWIFGVVDGQKKAVKDPKSYNLASRVRFSDARGAEPEKIELLQPAAEPEKGFQLKILSSPKPPSPAMYFRKNAEVIDPTPGFGITKTKLDLKEHVPNGRKYYLPHKIERLEWESQHTGDNLKQKVCCWPLRENQTFYFHIDFDNLSDAELELLLKALRPGEDYIHRLGLGKPLGLGCVTVQPLGVFLVDRVDRYSPEALDIGAPRYAYQIPLAWDEKAPALYETERACLGLEKADIKPDISLIDPDTLDLLNTVGRLKSQKLGTGIHYPYCTADQLTRETEGYEWFVANDKCEAGQRQALAPVEKETELEPLRTHPRP